MIIVPCAPVILIAPANASEPSRVISPAPVMSGFEQATFHVALPLAMAKSETLHCCLSLDGAGGSFHSLGAQTCRVWPGISIGIPSIDILLVTSQRSPDACGAGAGGVSAAGAAAEARSRSAANRTVRCDDNF